MDDRPTAGGGEECGCGGRVPKGGEGKFGVWYLWRGGRGMQSQSPVK